MPFVTSLVSLPQLDRIRPISPQCGVGAPQQPEAERENRGPHPPHPRWKPVIGEAQPRREDVDERKHADPDRQEGEEDSFAYRLTVDDDPRGPRQPPVRKANDEDHYEADAVDDFEHTLVHYNLSPHLPRARNLCCQTDGVLQSSS